MSAVKNPMIKRWIVAISTSVCFLISASAGSIAYNHHLYDPEFNHSSPGRFEITFFGDELTAATLVNPIFIRIHLENGVTLCQTLVDLEGSPTGSDPINLALYKRTRNDLALSARENSLSIVRWIANESEIWLKCSQSTSEWLSGPGGTQSPSGSDPVSFSIGGVATVDRDFLADYLSAGQANLPSNQRQNSLEPCSTLLCLNNNNANNPDSPVQLTFSAFIHSEGISTQEDPATIEWGDLYPWGIGYQTPLGSLSKATLFSQLSEPVLSESAYFFPGQAFGLCPFEASFTMGGNVPFYSTSIVVFSNANHPEIGFPLGEPYVSNNGKPGRKVPGFHFMVENLIDSGGVAYALDEDGYMNLNGQTAAHRVYLEYAGQSVFNSAEPIRVQGVVASNLLNVNLPFDLELLASTQPHAYVYSPDDGVDIQVHCSGMRFSLWTSQQLTGQLVDFGPQLQTWPDPNGVDDLLIEAFGLVDVQ